MSSPLVSVVIPSHGGRFTDAAIASVIDQTLGDWELVIVDDGSSDGTAQLVAKRASTDARIRVVTNQRNLGIVAARNRGFGATSADSMYVAFLDHDDIWMPIALEVLLAQLVAHPDAVAAHGTAILIDANGRRSSTRPEVVPSRRMGLMEGRLVPWPSDRPTEFANLAVEDCVVSVGSGLIRRAALERVGGFDPRAERAEDYDLWIRLSRIGPIAFASREVLGLRLHDGQTSHRPTPPRGQGLGYVRYQLIASPENTPEQRRVAIAGFRARQRQLLEQRWSALLSGWRHRDYAAVRRNLVDAAASVVAYARGRPWSWHR